MGSMQMSRRRHGNHSVQFRIAEPLEPRLLLSGSKPIAYGPDLVTAAPLTTVPVVTPASQPAHLVISPVWDSTINNDPNAALIKATLGIMMQNFESDYTTPITITVKFAEMTSGLAASSTAITEETYTSYRAALASHATSSQDTQAVASLPTTSTNPVNGGKYVELTDANARALGFSATPSGGLDATISLNMSEFNFSRFPNQMVSGNYDLIGSSSHEMDEVLGISSSLDFYNDGVALPTQFVAAEDLFRYDPTTGARSWTTNVNAEAAFSFSGGKNFVARFNQTKGGDFNDWYSPGTQVPQVQDAYGTPDATPNLGTEITVEDVLGYTLASGVIGGFKPDLTPAALQGWTSPLVVTTTKNSTVDSSSLTTAETLYLDAAVLNNGSTYTAAAETNVITLDGKTIFTFNDASGLAVNDSYYSLGLSLGELSAGSHTIKITADSTNAIAETIESNNTFSKTFTVTTAVAPQPDLAPYTPSGWSGPIVTATSSTSTTDAATITTANTVYVDAAWINNGTVSITKDFSVEFKLDGVVADTLTDSNVPLDPGYYDFATELDAGQLSAGTHTVEMIIDSGNVIAESNETNNTYTRSFTVTAALAKPAITKQPTAQSIAAGQKVTFTATASGNPTPTVQWQVSSNSGKSYSNISGATSTTYSFTTASSENGYLYRAVFTNSQGTATTSDVKLTVTAALAKPAITKQPTAQSIAAGQKVTFTATASGNPTPTVQWQVSSNSGKSYSNISGATSTTYSFTTATSENGYLYRAVFTNSQGTATTSDVKLTVTAALAKPAITKQPTAITTTSGKKESFTAAASGNPTPTVQWQISTNSGKSYSNISGATSVTYNFTTATTQNGDLFRAVFTNSQGTATTSAVKLTIS